MNEREKVGYPNNWFQIATEVKEKAGWKCVRCGHKDDKEYKYLLTVHHLDLNIRNNEWWNLAALCQRCHLILQGRSRHERGYIKKTKEWFIICVIEKQLLLFGKEKCIEGWYKPYVEGYLANKEGKEEKDNGIKKDNSSKVIAVP